MSQTDYEGFLGREVSEEDFEDIRGSLLEDKDDSDFAIYDYDPSLLQKAADFVFNAATLGQAGNTFYLVEDTDTSTYYAVSKSKGTELYISGSIEDYLSPENTLSNEKL